MATRYIGGETGHRSFFGGTRSKTQVAGLIVSVLIAFFGVMFTGWPGLVVGVVLATVVWLATATTHRGSYWERRTRRSQWKGRQTFGTDRFVPYSDQAWADAQEEARSVKGSKARARTLAGVRSRPDGADGMGWLDARREHAGIAWHAPNGEEPYLSVAFDVRGQLSGAEPVAREEAAQDGFGSLLADHAPHDSLVRGIQSLTRVLPPDLALNELWVAERLAEDAHPDAVQSYQEVLERTGKGSYVQRHLVVARWPLTADFYAAAATYGPGRDGWRALMKDEIDAMVRALRTARMGAPRPLTARGTVAMMLHQQNPSRPHLMVKDVDPRRMGLPSHDTWSATWVDDVDPLTGQNVHWGHRTAMISADQVETGPRSPFWLLSLLHAGAGIRTLSFHQELVPADVARAATSKDIVRDQAALIARQKKGEIADPLTDANLRGATARGADLQPGTGHHGSNWVGFITISEQDETALLQAARRLEQSARTSAGIQKLEWLNSYQAAAMGTTWPIARGLKPARTTMGARMMDTLAGRGEKEEKAKVPA